MNIFNAIIGFMQDGGIFMLPIAFVLAGGAAIAIERWIFLTNAKSSNRKAFDEILPLIKRQDYKAVLKLGEAGKAPVARIIGAGIARMMQSARREDIEYAMEEGVMEAVPQLEKRTQYLAMLANIATLLGLLGTLMGMIDAFSAVATADPARKAEMLSAAISEAMNCTAFGLIAAIPLLMGHAMLQSKTTEIVDSLEMAGVKVLNVLADRKPPVNPQARGADSRPAEKS